MLLHGPELLADMLRVEDKYRENSRGLELGRWLARPLRERARDNLARLASMLK